MTVAAPDRQRAAVFPRTAAWRVRLALAFASFAAAFLALELGLRAAGVGWPERVAAGERESRPSARFVVDEHTGWRMRPSSSFEHASPSGERIVYRSDARGFRCGESDTGRDGAPLLAVAGDSFAWGCDVQHEQSFAAIVARELGDWRLANVAMPGFGLDQIWLSVREQALPLRPQLVLVAIFLDDFERSRTAYREVEGFAKPLFALRDGELVRQSVADAPNALARWLGRLRTAQVADAVARHAGRHVRGGEWWELNAAILARLRSDCAEAGVPLAFVFVPDDRWTPFPSLRRHMGELDLTYVDPIEAEPIEPPGLYFEHTGRPEHLDADGHAWLGALIAAQLRGHATPSGSPVASPGPDAPNAFEEKAR